MKISHIEHIGIAVKNLDDSISLYENTFGLKCYKVEEVREQKVRTAFFKVGETKIELLESTDPNGPIGKFIEKKGEGLHHIAFAASDLQKSINELKDKGIKLIDEIPKPGADELNISFIHPKSMNGVLFELCE
jgi:methylmalonyl-CoA/ethylmalonyl-CoA epimerase